MIPTPTQLIAEIETGEIPLAEMLSKANCDSLLDQRDSDVSFDKLYSQFCERNDKLKFILNRDPTESIRKRSFVIASNATQRHEIASYISDDFELIAWESHALVDLEIPVDGSPFVAWLYSQYKAGKFPCPPYPYLTMSKPSFQSAAPYQDDALSLPVIDIDAASKWYAKHFGMTEVGRTNTPVPTVILERDGTRLGFAINGGDPAQDGAAIRVTNIAAIKEELDANGTPTMTLRIDDRDGEKHQVFFVVAPDGLCYYFHEPLAPRNERAMPEGPTTDG